jgi:hypothetical protein
MEHDNLMLMVGEIRSDVKKLLESSLSQDKRISSLERYRYSVAGFCAAAGMIVPTAIAKAFGWH